MHNGGVNHGEENGRHAMPLRCVDEHGTNHGQRVGIVAAVNAVVARLHLARHSVRTGNRRIVP